MTPTDRALTPRIPGPTLPVGPIWPLAGAVIVTGAWPLTGYLVGPVVLPATMVFLVLALAVIRRPEVGVALALVAAPFLNLRWDGLESLGLPGKPMHVLLPALIVSVTVYTLVFVSAGRQRRPAALTAAVAAFFLVALLASMQGLAPRESLGKLVIVGGAVCLFFSAYQVSCTRKGREVIVAGALIGLLAMALVGILEHYTGGDTYFGFIRDGVVESRLQGSFGHPNQYAGYIAVLVPVAAAISLTGSVSRGVRLLAAAALGAGLLALIFSYSRGAILAVAIGPVLWALIARPRAAVLFAVVAAISVPVMPADLKARFAGGSEGEVVLRKDIWGAAYDIYAQNPVLGVGPNGFSQAYAALPANVPHATQRRLLHQTEVLVPPHAQNLYLNFLAEEGTLGFASLAFLIVASLHLLRRGARASDALLRATCFGLGAGIAALCIHSMFDAGLVGEVAFPLFALLAATGHGVTALSRGPHEERPSGTGRSATATAA